MRDLDVTLFFKFDFELVVYDEIETFKNYKYQKDNVSYDYPFGNRKTKLASKTLLIGGDYDFVDDDYLMSQDYNYDSTTIEFQRSHVCLEPNYWNDIKEIPSQMSKFITSYFNKDPENETQSEHDCDGPEFHKLKYANRVTQSKNIMDEYGEGMIKDMIFHEIELKQSQFQTVTERKSVQFLEFLGELGGLFGTFEIVVAYFG